MTHPYLALTDETTRLGMLELARAGVIHVLGSDSHSSALGRPVALSAALADLRTVRPTCVHAGWIATTAPHAIVQGRELRAPF